MTGSDGLPPPLIHSFVPGFAEVMRTEAAHILSDPQFSHSPTLARLLQWLIEQTLAGRGDGLKSYTVAVEGMGKPESFDSQADSYPRVQVGRLRKALENHYAQHGPLGEQCIYLQPGSYRVRLGTLSQAYPTLYRPLSDQNPIAAEQHQTSSMARLISPQTQSEMTTISGKWLFVVLVSGLALIAVLFAWGVLPTGSGSRDTASNEGASPVVYLAPVTGADDAQSATIANSAYAFMADGLSRSWVAQLRLSSEGDTDLNNLQPVSYRIETQIGDGSDGNRILFVRLSNARSSTMLWSNSVILDESKPFAENIAPIISQLVSPFGAIARHETQLTNGNFRAGYTCLLGYLEYLSSRDPELRKPIRSCLQKPTPDARLEAVRFAFLSFFALDRDREISNSSAAIQEALILARQATSSDPKEAYGQFSVARAYFIDNDCESGRRYAQLAIDANRYDPSLLAVLGNFSSACGFDEGNEMLDMAYKYHVEGESYARLSLILAAIRKRDVERLATLREAGKGFDTVSAPYHYLCETLIATSLGDKALAKANWAKFVSATGKTKQSADAMIRPLILADAVRAKVVAYLTTQGIIE